MKIGLYDVDSHRFPNLALMKISAFYKMFEHYVEMWKPDEQYDRVFISQIFTQSITPIIENSKEVYYGGSGINLSNKLPYYIEHIYPDYDLYPQFNFALGFLTRGCPRCNHRFCITPIKDGKKSIKVADLNEFWKGQSEICLLDQNLLACKERIDLLQQLVESEATITFDGGLDARFVDDEVVWYLEKIKAKKLQFAWDDPREDMIPKFKMIRSMNLRKSIDICSYVLVNYWSSFEEDLYRVYSLISMGIRPYVMVYDKHEFVKPNGKLRSDVYERYSEDQIHHFKQCQHLQRWANSRSIYKICPKFEDYEPYVKYLQKRGCK